MLHVFWTFVIEPLQAVFKIFRDIVFDCLKDSTPPIRRLQYIHTAREATQVKTVSAPCVLDNNLSLSDPEELADAAEFADSSQQGCL